MKRLTYKLVTTVNRGSDEEPVMVDILTHCKIICSDDGLEANLAAARAEAYGGEVTVEEVPEIDGSTTEPGSDNRWWSVYEEV